MRTPPRATPLVSRNLANRLWSPGAAVGRGDNRGSSWSVRPEARIPSAAQGTSVRLDPALPVTVHAMDNVVAATLAQPRSFTTLLAAFALLAMLLAGAGLYAVVTYARRARGRRR